MAHSDQGHEVTNGMTEDVREHMSTKSSIFDVQQSHASGTIVVMDLGESSYPCEKFPTRKHSAVASMV